MKRILTLAIAAMLVVAFAIPAFAAPKVELVSGNVETTATFNGGTPWGVQEVPTLVNLKFKFSADNFVFNVKLDPIAGELTDYDFSLALPYVTVSGYYDSWTEYMGSVGLGYYHGSRELRVASDEKFVEMAGFNWAVYANDDNFGGAFDSMHAQIGIPVGEAFTATFNYAHDVTGERDYDAAGDPLTETLVVEHHANIDLSYSISDDLSVAVQAGKDITPFLDDFFFAGTVNFPVVEGISGVFFAQYGMGQSSDLNGDTEDEYTGFIGDVDFNNYGGYWNNYYGDTFESYLDLNYVNENAHGELFLDYASASDFVSTNTIIAFAEYVSNGKNSLWSSGNRRANYADTTDAAGRGWNTYFDWVRKNGGNEFAVRVNGTYDLYNTVDKLSAIPEADQKNLYGATMYAMFAPDAVPVVVTFKGTYNQKYKTYTEDVDGDDVVTFHGDEYFQAYTLNNWIGIRLTDDIHLAIFDRYTSNNQVGHVFLVPDETTADPLDTIQYTPFNPATIGFDVDAALVYAKDNVTFKVTGKNLAGNLGDQAGEIYLGFSF